MASEEASNTQINPSPIATGSTQNEPAQVQSNSIPQTQTTTQNELVPTQENTDLVLGIQRARRSKVWDDFVEQIVDGKRKATCNFCNKVLGADPANGTSHLAKHIGVCLQKKLKEQTILKSSVDNSGKVSVKPYVFDQALVRKDLATMVILHEYPLRIVEHVGFRRFVGNLQPLFKIPSRNTVRSDIIRIYGSENFQILKQFEDIDSRFAITTDMWTASNQKKGFMAVTAHFVDNEWNLQSRIVR